MFCFALFFVCVLLRIVMMEILTPERKKVEVKDELSKLLDFKKFDISELDCIFTDFKTTLDPFVQNREDMAKAEESFKKPRWNKSVRMRSSVNMCTP